MSKHSYTIRSAKPDDAESIFNTKIACWSITHPSYGLGITKDMVIHTNRGKNDEKVATAIANWQSGIASERSNKQNQTFVAENDGNVIGYVLPRIIDGDNWLTQLYVSPQEQGKGIGGALLQIALNWFGPGDVYLETAVKNTNAQKLYASFGFVDSGIKNKSLGELYEEIHIPQVILVLKR